MHTAAEIGIDDFQAKRSPGRALPHGAAARACGRTTKGGFYHDGRFATLRDVVEHYDGLFDLGLTRARGPDLVQYLLSI